jgi:hypothetical protein
MERYHVRLGKRRTTVTMDTIVSTYLALHLRVEPGTVEAHGTVRSWLQRQLDENKDPRRSYVSQWLLGRTVETLARPSLSEAYARWILR